MTYAEMFEAAMKVESREAAEELLAGMVAIALEVIAAITVLEGKGLNG